MNQHPSILKLFCEAFLGPNNNGLQPRGASILQSLTCSELDRGLVKLISSLDKVGAAAPSSSSSGSSGPTAKPTPPAGSSSHGAPQDEHKQVDAAAHDSGLWYPLTHMLGGMCHERHIDDSIQSHQIPGFEYPPWSPDETFLEYWHRVHGSLHQGALWSELPLLFVLALQDTKLPVQAAVPAQGKAPKALELPLLAPFYDLMLNNKARGCTQHALVGFVASVTAKANPSTNTEANRTQWLFTLQWEGDIKTKGGHKMIDKPRVAAVVQSDKGKRHSVSAAVHPLKTDWSVSIALGPFRLQIVGRKLWVFAIPQEEWKLESVIYADTDDVWGELKCVKWLANVSVYASEVGRSTLVNEVNPLTAANLNMSDVYQKTILLLWQKVEKACKDKRLAKTREEVCVDALKFFNMVWEKDRYSPSLPDRLRQWSIRFGHLQSQTEVPHLTAMQESVRQRLHSLQPNWTFSNGMVVRDQAPYSSSRSSNTLTTSSSSARHAQQQADASAHTLNCKWDLMRFHAPHSRPVKPHTAAMHSPTLVKYHFEKSPRVPMRYNLPYPQLALCCPLHILHPQWRGVYTKLNVKLIARVSVSDLWESYLYNVEFSVEDSVSLLSNIVHRRLKLSPPIDTSTEVSATASTIVDSKETETTEAMNEDDTASDAGSVHSHHNITPRAVSQSARQESKNVKCLGSFFIAPCFVFHQQLAHADLHAKDLRDLSPAERNLLPSAIGRFFPTTGPFAWVVTSQLRSRTKHNTMFLTLLRHLDFVETLLTPHLPMTTSSVDSDAKSALDTATERLIADAYRLPSFLPHRKRSLKWRPATSRAKRTKLNNPPTDTIPPAYALGIRLEQNDIRSSQNSNTMKSSSARSGAGTTLSQSQLRSQLTALRKVLQYLEICSRTCVGHYVGDGALYPLPQVASVRPGKLSVLSSFVNSPCQRLFAPRRTDSIALSPPRSALSSGPRAMHIHESTQLTKPEPFGAESGALSRQVHGVPAGMYTVPLRTSRDEEAQMRMMRVSDVHTREDELLKRLAKYTGDSSLHGFNIPIYPALPREVTAHPSFTNAIRAINTRVLWAQDNLRQMHPQAAATASVSSGGSGGGMELMDTGNVTRYWLVIRGKPGVGRTLMLRDTLKAFPNVVQMWVDIDDPNGSAERVAAWKELQITQSLAALSRLWVERGKVPALVLRVVWKGSISKLGLQKYRNWAGLVFIVCETQSFDATSLAEQCGLHVTDFCVQMPNEDNAMVLLDRMLKEKAHFLSSDSEDFKKRLRKLVQKLQCSPRLIELVVGLAQLLMLDRDPEVDKLYFSKGAAGVLQLILEKIGKDFDKVTKADFAWIKPADHAYYEHYGPQTNKPYSLERLHLECAKALCSYFGPFLMRHIELSFPAVTCFKARIDKGIARLMSSRTFQSPDDFVEAQKLLRDEQWRRPSPPATGYCEEHKTFGCTKGLECARSHADYKFDCRCTAHSKLNCRESMTCWLDCKFEEFYIFNTEIWYGYETQLVDNWPTYVVNDCIGRIFADVIKRRPQPGRSLPFAFLSEDMNVTYLRLIAAFRLQLRHLDFCVDIESSQTPAYGSLITRYVLPIYKRLCKGPTEQANWDDWQTLMNDFAPVLAQCLHWYSRESPEHCTKIITHMEAFCQEFFTRRAPRENFLKSTEPQRYLAQSSSVSHMYSSSSPIVSTPSTSTHTNGVDVSDPDTPSAIMHEEHRLRFEFLLVKASIERKTQQHAAHSPSWPSNYGSSSSQPTPSSAPLQRPTLPLPSQFLSALHAVDYLIRDAELELQRAPKRSARDEYYVRYQKLRFWVEDFQQDEPMSLAKIEPEELDELVRTTKDQMLDFATKVMQAEEKAQYQQQSQQVDTVRLMPRRLSSQRPLVLFCFDPETKWPKAMAESLATILHSKLQVDVVLGTDADMLRHGCRHCTCAVLIASPGYFVDSKHLSNVALSPGGDDADVTMTNAAASRTTQVKTEPMDEDSKHSAAVPTGAKRTPQARKEEKGDVMRRAVAELLHRESAGNVELIIPVFHNVDDAMIGREDAPLVRRTHLHYHDLYSTHSPLWFACRLFALVLNHPSMGLALQTFKELGGASQAKMAHTAASWLGEHFGSEEKDEEEIKKAWPCPESRRSLTLIAHLQHFRWLSVLGWYYVRCRSADWEVKAKKGLACFEAALGLWKNTLTRLGLNATHEDYGTLRMREFYAKRLMRVFKDHGGKVAVNKQARLTLNVRYLLESMMLYLQHLMKASVEDAHSSGSNDEFLEADEKQMVDVHMLQDQADNAPVDEASTLKQQREKLKFMADDLKKLEDVVRQVAPSAVPSVEYMQNAVRRYRYACRAELIEADYEVCPKHRFKHYIPVARLCQRESVYQRQRKVVCPVAQAAEVYEDAVSQLLFGNCENALRMVQELPRVQIRSREDILCALLQWDEQTGSVDRGRGLQWSQSDKEMWANWSVVYRKSRGFLPDDKAALLQLLWHVASLYQLHRVSVPELNKIALRRDQTDVPPPQGPILKKMLVQFHYDMLGCLRQKNVLPDADALFSYIMPVDLASQGRSAYSTWVRVFPPQLEELPEKDNRGGLPLRRCYMCLAFPLFFDPSSILDNLHCENL